MKIFICKRGMHDWEGALIIAAPNKEIAQQIFFNREEEVPNKIEEYPLNEGILYDDELR